MNKKLPSVFVNKNIKSNNQKTNYSNNIIYNDIDIKSKILNIINDVDFVYRKKVIIYYKNNSSETLNIIGLLNDDLVTLENKTININEIKDIKKVDVTQKS